MNSSKKSLEIEAKIELAKRELARRRLIDFISYHYPSYKVNWHHRLIADKLDQVERGETRKIIFTLPPRHGKSELISRYFPAYLIGKNRDRNIIEASYSGDLAVGFGRDVRNIIFSEKYKNIFPQVELAQDSQAKGKWHTNGRGEYNAVGVGGAITGKGADFLIIDDPVKNRKDAESQVVSESTWNWYTSTALTRLSPNGAVIIVMTRWHDDDLVGRLMASETAKEWEIVHFPAIAEDNEEFRAKGEALWADHYTLEKLNQIKTEIGAYDWASLYQGNPVTSESQEFRKDLFKYRTEDDIKDKRTNRFLTIDLAFSDKDTADNIGFCDNRVDPQNCWNLKAWAMKLSPKDFIDYLFILHRDNNYQTIGILDKHSQYTIVIKPFIDEECRKRNRFLPVITVKTNDTSKETRIRGLLYRYLNSAVYHIQNSCIDLELELLRFPKGVHDDVADATSSMIDIAVPPNSDELYMLHRRTVANKKVKNNAL